MARCGPKTKQINEQTNKKKPVRDGKLTEATLSQSPNSPLPLAILVVLSHRREKKPTPNLQKEEAIKKSAWDPICDSSFEVIIIIAHHFLIFP